ncbi:MAG: type III-A CRISPR-associated RAMP protein Csm5, partial [Desulfatirhabdiaceae bacterium]
MKEIFHCVIRTLSPVHIGCGEVYEPTGFVVDEQKKELVVFDPFQFIAGLPDTEKDRLIQICQKGNIASILEVFKFFKNRQAIGNRVALSEGFMKHYGQTLSMSTGNPRQIQQELNRFSINRTSFLPGYEAPFLPGSSVKGSLRTAFLNLRQKESPVTPDSRDRTSIKLEEKLLKYRSLNEDPFRLVKVSDFMPIGETNRKVMYAVDIKKKPGQVPGAYQIVEAIMPGALFWGSIQVDAALSGSGITKPVKLLELTKSAWNFYGGEKKRENRELLNAGCPAFNRGDDGAIPLRVGRHSGAECVTIEGHRSIWIMNLKKTLDHATTFWLASDTKRPETTDGLLPFGWVELVIISENDFNRYRNTPLSMPAPVITEPVDSADSNVPEENPQPSAIVETQEHWPTASLTWKPGNNTLEASFNNRKAIATGKNLVPEAFHKKL